MADKIKVVVVKDEVQGFVGRNQVYGVYIDDHMRLRVSTAQAPCGSLEQSRAIIECMQQVLDKVESLTGYRS